MVAVWLLTLPAAATVGALAAAVAARGTAGTMLVAGVLVVASAGIYALSRRKPVTAKNVTELPAPHVVPEPARAAA
jgi:PiT family inorganic phosphate transporter